MKVFFYVNEKSVRDIEVDCIPKKDDEVQLYGKAYKVSRGRFVIDGNGIYYACFLF